LLTVGSARERTAGGVSSCRSIDAVRIARRVHASTSHRSSAAGSVSMNVHRVQDPKTASTCVAAWTAARSIPPARR
jgi:hypothetical protein